MRKIKSILLLIVLFVSGTAFGQGLYDKPDNSSSNASFYSASGEKPRLRAGGGDPPVVDPPKEPGSGTPVGGGLLILMSLSGIYFSKVYYDNKKKKA